MSAEDQKKTIPSASYYEKPYLPTPTDRQTHRTIPLLPVEAHSILVSTAGKKISTIDKMTLKRIASEEGDVSVDFLTVRKKILIELETDEDWD